MRNRPYCYSKVVNISVFKMIARVSSIIENSVESFTRNQIKVFISFVRGRTSDVSHLLMVFFFFNFYGLISLSYSHFLHLIRPNFFCQFITKEDVESKGGKNYNNRSLFAFIY